MDRVVNRAGFSYGRDGWHPYVAALEQWLAEPHLAYGDTVLAAFYARFRPQTVHELLLGGKGLSRGRLAGWPALDRLIDLWSATRRDVGRVSAEAAQHRDLAHSQYRGPTDPSVGAMHIHRVVTAYESFAQHGHQPDRFPSGFVTGYFLTQSDDYRFVVGHGNHRVAALRVLGYRHIPVVLRPSHPPVVARERLARWTTTRGGLLEPAEVDAVVGRFFADDSRERAVALGLL